MRNNTDPKRRRRREAVRGVAIFDVFQLACAALLAALCFIPELPGWCVVLFGVLAAGCLLPVIGAAAVLRERFREIERGELQCPEPD